VAHLKCATAYLYPFNHRFSDAFITIV